MLNTRRDVALQVAAELIPLEADIDSAIVRQAKLQIAAIEGRRTAKLPLEAGQKGLELVAEATAALLAARGKIHEAHRVFRQVQDDMGVKTLGFGDYGDTPGAFDTTERPMLSVASAA